MKRNTNLFVLLLLGLLTACSSSVQDTSSDDSDVQYAKGQSAVIDENSPNHILKVAIGSKDHSTLVAGVQAAELEDVLVNAGPLTVFAPNNAAFDQLPAGTLESLLEPENKSTLARIIKHHAAPGNYTSDKLRDGQNLYMATGVYLKVEKQGEDIFIDGAKVLGTVPASNGVVHVVDKVLLPPERN